MGVYRFAVFAISFFVLNSTTALEAKTFVQRIRCLMGLDDLTSKSSQNYHEPDFVNAKSVVSIPSRPPKNLDEIHSLRAERTKLVNLYPTVDAREKQSRRQMLAQIDDLLRRASSSSKP